MARIRSIHPGLFTDDAILEMSFEGRFCLIGIWTLCDDRGIFEWKPITLKMRLVPADNTDIGSILSELVKLQAIVKFEDDNKPYGAVRNFCKWQRPKVPQYVHPCPDDIAEFVAFQPAKPDKPERGTALGKLLHEQQDGRCFYCHSEITFYRKKPNSLEIDHRIPVSREGTDSIENLVASCRKCNSLKANMTDVEFRAKFSASELRERHGSEVANVFSGNANTESKVHSLLPNTGSPMPKSATREPTNQREEGGCRKDPSELVESRSLGEIIPHPRTRGQA